MDAEVAIQHPDGTVEYAIIKECGRCGGSPIFEAEFKPCDGRCWIHCDKCGMHSAWHDSLPEAIKDWNERMERKNLRARKEK